MRTVQNIDRNVYSKRIVGDAEGLLVREFRSLGFGVDKIAQSIRVHRDGRFCFLIDSDTNFTSHVAARMLKNKEIAKTVLRNFGLSVAAGRKFRKDEREAALRTAVELGTSVVKPVDGNKGKGVSVNVTPETFEAAWYSAARFTAKEIIVEKFFSGGQDARYLVVDGNCVAVQLRIPPFVIGDGISTIERLIAEKNDTKKKNASRRKCLIKIDDHRKAILRSQGFSVDSVPACGQHVVIDWKAGLSTGGDAKDITSTAHASMKRVAEMVTEAIPGLHVVGVDILANDHSQEAAPENYIIVEANTRPMLIGHHFPDFGQPINVSRMIAESCARKLGFSCEDEVVNICRAPQPGDSSPVQQLECGGIQQTTSHSYAPGAQAD